jgi:hypothetical protein
MTSRKVVRPNRWDVRERRLEDNLSGIVYHLKALHPEYFDKEHASRLQGLDLRVSLRRAEKELARRPMSDLDDRVRNPVTRWWRERKVAPFATFPFKRRAPLTCKLTRHRIVGGQSGGTAWCLCGDAAWGRR